MANTLTSLIPSMYAALDVVSRELVGAIPSVTLDAQASRAAVGQAVLSDVAPASAGGAITPAVTPPDDGDQTIGNRSVTIDTAWRVPFRWNGEEELGMNNRGGAGVSAVQANQLQQAIRTIVNKMEASILVKAALGASRAYGAVSTVPFTTDLEEAAQIRKILDDNGAPGSRSLIIDTTAGVKMRKLTQLTKANEAGTSMTLRDGELLDIFGLSVKESAGFVTTAVGTNNGYTSSTAGFPVGTQDIAVITGSSTLIAGDIITFAGDTNKYVVETGVTAPGTLRIAAPGLRQAIPAAATAITLVATGRRLVGFSQSSIVLATRAPALPSGGDMAVDRTMITDPRSGLSFEVAMYAQYRQMQYEVSACWGSAVIKPEHCAVLLT